MPAEIRYVERTNTDGSTSEEIWFGDPKDDTVRMRFTGEDLTPLAVLQLLDYFNFIKLEVDKR